MSHTPEPWKLDEYGTVSDGNGQIIGNPANARRIVACVNACAGIDTDELESLPRGLLTDPACDQYAAENAALRNSVERLTAALHTQAEESAKLLARVEVAEAGFKAAVSKAQWQARTNEELNRLVAQREGLLEVLKPFADAYEKWSGGRAVEHFSNSVSPADFHNAFIITKHTTTNEGN